LQPVLEGQVSLSARALELGVSHTLLQRCGDGNATKVAACIYSQGTGGMVATATPVVGSLLKLGSQWY
jgi:hypothetical protein